MHTLRFRARGSALVTNFERLEAGVKSFIGRRWTEVEPGRKGFVPTEADEAVPYRAEYVKACQDGDLYPADLATAKVCGVSFDPSFGAPAKSAKQDKASDKG